MWRARYASMGSIRIQLRQNEVPASRRPPRSSPRTACLQQITYCTYPYVSCQSCAVKRIIQCAQECPTVMQQVGRCLYHGPGHPYTRHFSTPKSLVAWQHKIQGLISSATCCTSASSTARCTCMTMCWTCMAMVQLLKKNMFFIHHFWSG